MWINDGNLEHVGLFLDKISVVEGGYIMVFQLANNEIRIAASNDPARYLAAWKNKILITCGSDIAHIWVSPPHIKYEKIKRLLQARLGSGDTIASIETKLKEIFQKAGY